MVDHQGTLAGNDQNLLQQAFCHSSSMYCKPFHDLALNYKVEYFEMSNKKLPVVLQKEPSSKILQHFDLGETQS